MTGRPANHPRAGAVAVEGWRSALARPVATVTAALVVAVACLVVYATVGRTAAQTGQVLAQMDSPATRLLSVSDDGGRAGMVADTVRAIHALDGVAWVLAVGPAEDVHNADWPADDGVPRRAVYGDVSALRVTSGRAPRRAGEALAGPDAWAALHMADPAGEVTAVDPASTTTSTLVGTFDLPEVAALRGNLLSLGADDPNAPVRFVYVLAKTTADVDRLDTEIPAVVVATQPAQVDVEDSQGAIALRAAVSGELTRGAAGTVSLVLATGLILVSITLFGATATRRRDFGRLRALGASRSLIVVLVLVQAAVAGVAGAGVGAGAGIVVCHALSGAAPPASFDLGVGVLALITTLLGALVPAMLAARRDPVTILRVP